MVVTVVVAVAGAVERDAVAEFGFCPGVPVPVAVGAVPKPDVTSWGGKTFTLTLTLWEDGTFMAILALTFRGFVPSSSDLYPLEILLDFLLRLVSESVDVEYGEKK